MRNTFHGLPTHALIVHFTVVALPTAAITAIIMALWPWARRRYGVLVGLLTIVAVALVPVTGQSGEDLYARQSARFGRAETTEAGLTQKHMDLVGAGAPVPEDGAAPARGTGGAGRLELTGAGAPGWQLPAMAVGIVLTLVGGILTLVIVARVGEAGARAAWEHLNVPTRSQTN